MGDSPRVEEDDLDIEDDEDPYEMAVEWFDYNVIGAWMGDTTPLYIKVL